VDARLEVAVARQHGGAHQVVAGDGVVELGREVARVANAGGAAVTRQRKTQLFQIRQQAGLREVFSDDARAGRQRCLDVGLDLEAGFHRLLGQQTGGQHHARVAGIGAAGDGGNQHIAIAHGDIARTRRLLRWHLGVRCRQRRPVLLHLCHKARGARGGWLFAGWRSQR